MCVRVLGRVIVIKFSQYAKAYGEISVMPSGRVTEVIELLLPKALALLIWACSLMLAGISTAPVAEGH